MKNPAVGFGVVFLLAASVGAAPPDREVLRLAGWLVGTFDNQAQAAAEKALDAAARHDAVVMIGRPVNDPQEFQDALYLYMERRREGEPRPFWQRIYRLRRSGKQVRIDVLRIDGQLLGPLGTDAQMLNSLNPGDLKKEAGCEFLLDIKADEFAGSTAPSTCRSAEEGAAYLASTLRVTRDLVVTLDRGYDEKGTQTFGPRDERGYEFRRVQK